MSERYEQLKKQYDEILEKQKSAEQKENARQAIELGYVKRNLEAWTDRALTAEHSLELAVKALEEIHETYMKYLDNELECDSAASDMDDIAENAISQIRR